MFEGDSITELVDALTGRGVKLFHACQFADFCSYLKLGGIPSRNLLEQRQLDVTKFESDADDKKGGVWTKVYFNLEDFGKAFASLQASTPVAYGPINFSFSPCVLKSATDVAINFISGATSADRQSASLATLEEVERLFYFPSGPNLKNLDLLKEAFPDRTVVNRAEVSCTFETEIGSFSELAYIRCDPITIDGHRLVDLVQQELDNAKIHKRAYERDVDHSGHQELTDLVSSGVETFQALRALELSEQLQTWIERYAGKSYAAKNFHRYASYLRSGTIDFIKSRFGKAAG